LNLGSRFAGRYGLALLLLVVALVYTIAIPDGEWQRVGALALQSAALFATLAASEVDSRILNGLAFLFVLALLGAVAQAGFADGDSAGFVRSSVLAILLMSLPLVGRGVVRQVRSDRKVSVQTMMGVLCAYLLLMSSFAYAYSVIGEFGSEPFFSQGAQWNTLGDYIYFSLITITTVGMGDLTPATDLGRSLTAAEALIGQIYMVTVVAVIVSNLGRTRPRSMDAQPAPGAGAQPGTGDTEEARRG
jgi:hypothetical protein